MAASRQIKLEADPAVLIVSDDADSLQEREALSCTQRALVQLVNCTVYMYLELIPSVNDVSFYQFT